MGIVSSSAWDPVTQIPNLNGKVALVTGAYGEIGYEIAQHLALNGAKVWMAARSEAKSQAAIEKYRLKYADVKSEGTLNWLPLDLSTPTEVMKAVEIFLRSEKRLDILINNATRTWSSFVLTEDGVELSVSTNHIGHFTLTQALLPLLQHTSSLPNSDVRVITVASGAHKYISSIEINTKSDLNKTFAPDNSSLNSGGYFGDKAKRYYFSKLLNVIFATELQRRFDAQGIDLISISLDPGMVYNTSSGMPIPSWSKPLYWALSITALQGATAALFASTANQVREKSKEYNGAYLAPGGKKSEPSKLSQDKELAKNLWKVSEELVSEILKSYLPEFKQQIGS